MNSIKIGRIKDKSGGTSFYELEVDSKSTLGDFVDGCDIVNNNDELRIYVIYGHCGKIPIYKKSKDGKDAFSYGKGYWMFKDLKVERAKYEEYILDGKGCSCAVLWLKEAGFIRKAFDKTLRRCDFFSLYERTDSGAVCM